MKRLVDFWVAFIGLIILSPFILVILLLICTYDWHSPLYRPIRVGKNFRDFKMMKFRTMVANADKIGSSSTSSRDPRITPIGHIIRKYKFDEFAQLWNVLVGDMSLVGPRPQVKSHVEDCYTKEEKRLLSVKPGITDFSSIVFSDEGEILKDSKNVDIDYNRLIRPWKSRLGLIYVDNQNLFLDLKLIYLTIIAIVDKPAALKSLHKILCNLNVEQRVLEVSKRKNPLYPFPPPGAVDIAQQTH